MKVWLALPLMLLLAPPTTRNAGRAWLLTDRCWTGGGSKVVDAAPPF